MKLSKNTIEVLKNFATINTNILVREGSTLSTISTGKNIFARADIEESFPQEFAVYDLNSLLSLLTVIEDPDVVFEEERLLVSKGASRFEYYFADPNIIVSAPDKTIEVDNFFEFELNKDNVEMILKAAGITGAPMLSIKGDGENIRVEVGDPNTPKSNAYRTDVVTSDVTFDARLAIENFKVIPDTYKVIISKKKFMYLESKAGRKYWLALERSSDI